MWKHHGFSLTTGQGRWHSNVVKRRIFLNQRMQYTAHTFLLHARCLGWTRGLPRQPPPTHPASPGPRRGSVACRPLTARRHNGKDTPPSGRHSIIKKLVKLPPPMQEKDSSTVVAEHRRPNPRAMAADRTAGSSKREEENKQLVRMISGSPTLQYCDLRQGEHTSSATTAVVLLCTASKS